MCNFAETRRVVLRVWPGTCPGVLILLLAGLSGCGNSSVPEASQASSDAVTGQAADTLPVASIGAGEAEHVRTASEVNVVPGSPEALLLEITHLIAQANASVNATPSPQPPTADADADSAVATDGQPAPDAATSAYRKSLEQIIDLATQVIAATHLDPEQEQAFNNAVHYLSDARLELASTGDAGQARLLIEDADSLYERDPQSFAAAESGFKVVELAERMAQSLGGNDPDWLIEYATQAQQYSERYPQERSRAAMALFTAGRLCDRHNLGEAAVGCLTQVQQRYADTLFAEQSAGILRRLLLAGKPVELAGSTIDGGFVEIEQYRGRAVLVVFWATTSPSFVEQVAAVRQLEQKYAASGLSIIGVNLDMDEATVDRFLADQQLTWPQVFSADPTQRGGRNPVARYYGIQVLPTYWLIDPRGQVARTTTPVESLDSEIAVLLRKS